MSKTWLSKLSLAGSASLFVLLLSACAAGPTNPSPELLNVITAARTSSDHEALAKYYDSQAAASHVQAEKYKKWQASIKSDRPSGRGVSNPKARFDWLINIYEADAVEYEGLAGKQRILAGASHS